MEALRKKTHLFWPHGRVPPFDSHLGVAIGCPPRKAAGCRHGGLKVVDDVRTHLARPRHALSAARFLCVQIPAWAGPIDVIHGCTDAWSAVSRDHFTWNFKT